MKVLFLAPLPPPIDGQSLASKVLLAELAMHCDVDVVELGRNSQRFGGVTRRRLVAVLQILRDVWVRRQRDDVAYFTISESIAGNLKDLAIYAILRGRLDRMVIHLHGGSIGEELFDRYPRLRRWNAAFLRRIGGVIISGPSHARIFRGMVAAERVHIVPNFATEDLFVDKAQCRTKWESSQSLRLLYISTMVPQKGYRLLLEAVESLSDAQQAAIHVDFAGKFESDDERAAFLARIKGRPNVRYHGIVRDTEKRRLFAEAHVFCLPTAYREGQPISILEAYASACVVLTTGQPGILDIFSNRVNGFVVTPGSAPSIREAIEAIIAQRAALPDLARHNQETAMRQYTVSAYASAIRRILEHATQSASSPAASPAPRLSPTS